MRLLTRAAAAAIGLSLLAAGVAGAEGMTPEVRAQLVERLEVKPDEIQHVIMGNALQTSGDAIYGPVHTNDTLKIYSSGATFYGTVTTAKVIKGVSYGTFSLSPDDAMRLVEVAVGSVDPTVGAVRSNRERVARLAREMAADGATVGCFPEQVLGGYPPEDLVQWRAFVAAQSEALRQLAGETADLGMVLVVGLAVEVEALLFNAAAVVHRGEILGLVPKEKLPTYNVFYEGRTFARGGSGPQRRKATHGPIRTAW